MEAMNALPINDEERGEEEEELINQIELEMRKIHISVEKLYNNISLSESTDPIEKCCINNYFFATYLHEKGVNDIHVENGDALKVLEESLQDELDFLTTDIVNLLKKMDEYKEMYDSLDKNIATLNEMAKAAEPETSVVSKLHNVKKNIKIRFQKEKGDLKTIINLLFADNYDIQDLIARITEHHFSEGSDKYLQLEDEDNIIEQIELLRRTNLFQVNPHDILQIRLADLV